MFVYNGGMNTEQLAGQRALWSSGVKNSLALMAGVECKEYLTDYSNIIVLRHKDSPGWKATLTINSAKGQRNRLELNGKNIGAYNKATMPKIVDQIVMLRSAYNEGVANTRTIEAKAAAWIARQEVELRQEMVPAWMDAAIITNGVHEGSYRISFDPGCPLEHLELEHVKALIQLCWRIGS